MSVRKIIRTNLFDSEGKGNENVRKKSLNIAKQWAFLYQLRAMVFNKTRYNPDSTKFGLHIRRVWQNQSLTCKPPSIHGISALY